MDARSRSLLDSVEIIARHRDYPGKTDLVRAGLDEIEARGRRGELSADEVRRLRTVLVMGNGAGGQSAEGRLGCERP